MRWSEISEDVEADVQFSQYGELTRRAICDRLAQGFDTQNSDCGKVMKIKTRDSVLNAMLQNLTVKFSATQDSHFGKTQYGLPIIQINIGKKLSPERALEYLQSAKGSSTFRHEFQHYFDDQYRYGKEVGNQYSADDVLTSADKKQYMKYFNDPKERNAFFHEMAEPLLAILRAVKEEDIDTLGQLSKIEPDFRKYFKGQFLHQDHENGIAYHFLTHENRKQLVKRLYLLHRAATGVQGMSAPYEPSQGRKVLQWLAQGLTRMGALNVLKF